MSRQSRTREETKQATRVALINAGITEFAHHGFEVSLDAICARAKLTRGAFYVHFADRDAFIVAVMQHVLGGFVTALTGPAAPVGGAAPVQSGASLGRGRAVDPSGLGPSLDLATSIRLFIAAIRSRAPVVSGGAGLRFHHVLEACRRSKAIGNTYRGVVAVARSTIVAAIIRDRAAGKVHRDRDPDGLADLMVAIALGMLAVNELDLPVDLDRLEAAMLGVLT
ncbi:MAG TPA: TetR/AcrR family transcriptional regulator [Kofleriaceae bacterium]